MTSTSTSESSTSFPPYVNVTSEGFQVPIKWSNDPVMLGFDSTFLTTKEYPDNLLKRLATTYGYASVLPMIYEGNQPAYILRGQDSKGQPGKHFLYYPYGIELWEIKGGMMTGKNLTEVVLNSLDTYGIGGLTVEEVNCPPAADDRKVVAPFASGTNPAVGG